MKAEGSRSHARPYTVTLTPREAAEAERVGRARYDESIGSRRRDYWGMGKDSSESHEFGAKGEFAFCKMYGILWDKAVNQFAVPDIRGQVEIRTLRDSSRVNVKVKPKDRDDAIVVLMRRLPGKKERFEFVGWVFAGDVKKDEFWKDPGGRGAYAWFAPKAALYGPEELAFDEDAGEFFDRCGD
jgi:hypothetical protein